MRGQRGALNHRSLHWWSPWSTVRVLISFGVGQPVAVYRELYTGVDENRLRSTVEVLASFPSRVVG